MFFLYLYVYNADADVSNRSNISMWMMIYSWSRTRQCLRDFVSRLSDFEYFF